MAKAQTAKQAAKKPRGSYSNRIETLLNIYLILAEANTRLSVTEIWQKLPLDRDTQMKPSRYTVDRLLQDLFGRIPADGVSKYLSGFPFALKCETFDYALGEFLDCETWGASYRASNYTRYYTLVPLLEPAQFRMLYDLVQVYPYISKKQTTALLNALKKMAPGLKGTGTVDAPKRGSDQLFDHIAVLNDAIESGNKVEVAYGQYTLENGSRTPKLKARPTHPTWTLEPYALIWANGYYYLTAMERNVGRGIMNLRLDRILNVTKLNDTFQKPNPPFNPAVHRDKSPVMFSGKAEYVQLRCSTSMINTVLDLFGSRAHFTPPKDGMTDVDMTVTPGGVKLFAMEYADTVEVIQPEWLRKDVKASLDAALKKYRKAPKK